MDVVMYVMCVFYSFSLNVRCRRLCLFHIDAASNTIRTHIYVVFIYALISRAIYYDESERQEREGFEDGWSKMLCPKHRTNPSTDYMIIRIISYHIFASHGLNNTLRD